MNSIAAVARAGAILVAGCLLAPLFVVGLLALYLWPDLERIAYSRQYRQLYRPRKRATSPLGGIRMVERSARSPAPAI